MARIYKKTDRVKLKIDDVIVTIRPLTVDQKTEVQQALLHGRAKADVKQLTSGLTLSIKYGLTKIEGVEDANGKPYELQFENDVLTEECINDIMNLDIQDKLTVVCAKLVKSLPTEILNDEGQPLTGVEFLSLETEPTKK